MSLLGEVQTARKKVVTDGYEMSLGELINLYKSDELKNRPGISTIVSLGR